MYTQPKNKRMQIDTKKHKQVTTTDFLFKVQICNYHLKKFIYEKRLRKMWNFIVHVSGVLVTEPEVLAGHPEAVKV